MSVKNVILCDFCSNMLNADNADAISVKAKKFTLQKLISSSGAKPVEVENLSIDACSFDHLIRALDALGTKKVVVRKASSETKTPTPVKRIRRTRSEMEAEKQTKLEQAQAKEKAIQV